MKVVKISRVDWNVNCPHCGEYVTSYDIQDVENDEILTCSACKRKVKAQLVNEE